MYVHRDIEICLKRLVKQLPAVALTGPRQSGKSTLLRRLFGATHQLVSFDDPFTRQQAISDPELFLENIRGRAIFDEIQYVPELTLYLKIRIDRDRQHRGRFLLTGSQEFHLIKNLGDSLAGRVGLLSLLPFSQHERRSAPSLRHRLGTQLSTFVDACLRGSYPEVSLHRKIGFDVWYGSYIQSYLERDVRSIHNIGSLRDFQRFLQLLATRCAQALNLTSLSSEIGVSVNTVKQWVSVLEASRIVYLLQPYYRNLGKRITKSPKIYFFDCGLVCYLTGIRDRRHLLSGPLAGALFENYVIQETLKTYFNQAKRPNVFYLRTHNGIEVDLIVEQQMQVFPFEIKLTQSPRMELAKPLMSFKRIFSHLNIIQAGVICLSEEDRFLQRGISVRSLEGFLTWLKTRL